MDINLAGEMSGIDAVKEINRTGGVPVIYVTANSDDITRNKAMKTGPAGYLNKPIDFRELLSLMKGILEKEKIHNTPGNAGVNALKCMEQIK